MLTTSITLILLSSALNTRRDFSILYNRIAILVLFYCIINDYTSLMLTTKGIGLHGGLLLVTSTTQIFHIFVYFISGLILSLTSFYPRKV
jgi:NADH-ubiquinone oxidoreductase chain 2